MKKYITPEENQKNKEPAREAVNSFTRSKYIVSARHKPRTFWLAYIDSHILRYQSKMLNWRSRFQEVLMSENTNINGDAVYGKSFYNK